MKINFLSGLPRTGSTLLSSILNQNPSVYSGPNSPLCQLMWDMEMSCTGSEEEIKNTFEVKNKIIKEIPKIFYSGIDKNIIDKCRTWTLPGNLDLIDKYITKNPKIVVMVRPIIDIVKSFVYIRNLNNWENPEYGLLDENSDPIMLSYNGVLNAKRNNNGQFLFVEYDSLVDDTKNTINKIYDFYEIEKFDHDFNSIYNMYPERDDILQSIGLHDIRPQIRRRSIDIDISDELYQKAIELRY